MLGDSFEQTNEKRQQTPSKKKSIQNQSKQSGTGIRMRILPPSGICG